MASDNETHAEIVATFRERCDGPFMADVNGFVVDFKSQEGLTFANRIEAAHRREIENVRALVKELADALDNRIDCRSECDGCSMPSCTNKANRALVARARKALKGADDGNK